MLHEQATILGRRPIRGRTQENILHLGMLTSEKKNIQDRQLLDKDTKNNIKIKEDIRIQKFV